MSARTLTAADVDAIVDALAERLADAVADRLAERGTPLDRRLVSAVQLAPLLGLTPRWVREHAAELGGRRATDGPRGRWRFDPAEARERRARRVPRRPTASRRSARGVVGVPARTGGTR